MAIQMVIQTEIQMEIRTETQMEILTEIQEKVVAAQLFVAHGFLQLKSLQLQRMISLGKI